MNPAVLNNMTRLTVIDGYEVWYFGAATKQTLRPYLVIALEGYHVWVSWGGVDWFGRVPEPVGTFIQSHSTLAITTV